jgi:hypothetical protein
MAMLWALAQMLGCCRNERVLHALKPKQDSIRQSFFGTCK